MTATPRSGDDADRPRLLARLVLERVDDAGESPVFALRDPAGDVALELDEVSYALARQLDGRRTLDEICAELVAEGVPATRAGAERLCRELADKGALEGTTRRAPELPADAAALVERAERWLAEGMLGEAHRYASAAQQLAPGHPRVRAIVGATDAAVERDLAQTTADVARALAEEVGAPASQELPASWTHPSPGEARRARRGLLARRVGLAAALLLAAWLVPYPRTVKVDFRLEPAPGSQVVVRAEVEGLLVDVRRDEGDTIEAGEVLATFDDREITADLEENGLRQVELRAALSGLRHGATAAERKRGAQRIQLRRVELETKRAACVRLEGAVRDRLVAREELDLCRSEAAERAAALEQAVAEQAAAVEGARPEVLRQQEARLAALELRKRWLEHQLERHRVRSPVKGLVLAPIAPKRGTRLQPGDEVARLLASDAELIAVLAVPEPELEGVASGRDVQLRLRASPGTLLSTRIERVSPQLDPAADPRLPALRRAYARVSGAELRPGMNGVASVHLGSSSLLGEALRGVRRWVLLHAFFW